MRTKLLIASALMASCFFGATAAIDPVVMNINGKDVKASEFKYLYNKNRQQQIEQQSFDDYVDMFVQYKLKVDAAEKAGIDTTAQFVKEFSGYRKDLARPYLEDSTALEPYAREAYARLGEEVDVWHIMLPKEVRGLSHAAVLARADGIRQCAVNGEDFAELADKFSYDPGKVVNHGNMGWIAAGLYPYSFEKVAWSLPLNQISEVTETDFGYHIIKVTGRRPYRGEVHVAHILLLTPRDADEAARAAVKTRIDSIYNAAISGEDFHQLAYAYSEDPGSSRQGGTIKWFPSGRMVREFNEVAFDLPDGAISKPFQTRFGWHIIKKLGSRGLQPYEEKRAEIIAHFKNDERGQAPYTTVLDRVKTKEHYKVEAAGRQDVIDRITNVGQYDQAVAQGLKASSTPVISFAKTKLTQADLVAKLPSPEAGVTADDAEYIVDRAINQLGQEAIADFAMTQLENNNQDFANIVREYRDGLLLFEISNRNVWEKGATDAEGQKQYFETHRADYNWNRPHYKGYLIQVKSDSVCDVIREEVKTIVSADTLPQTIRKNHRGFVRVEKLLVAEGENPIIDGTIFHPDGPAPAPSTGFVCYLTTHGRVIDNPEEVEDVKAKLVEDYQKQLETEWVSDMKSKAKVTINRKELDKLSR